MPSGTHMVWRYREPYARDSKDHSEEGIDFSSKKGKDILLMLLDNTESDIDYYPIRKGKLVEYKNLGGLHEFEIKLNDFYEVQDNFYNELKIDKDLSSDEFVFVKDLLCKHDYSLKNGRELYEPLAATSENWIRTIKKIDNTHLAPFYYFIDLEVEKKWYSWNKSSPIGINKEGVLVIESGRKLNISLQHYLSDSLRNSKDHVAMPTVQDLFQFKNIELNNLTSEGIIKKLEQYKLIINGLLKQSSDEGDLDKLKGITMPFGEVKVGVSCDKVELLTGSRLRVDSTRNARNVELYASPSYLSQQGHLTVSVNEYKYSDGDKGVRSEVAAVRADIPIKIGAIWPHIVSLMGAIVVAMISLRINPDMSYTLTVMKFLGILFVSYIALNRGLK